MDEESNIINSKDAFETRWSNPPKLSDIKQDLGAAKADHDSHVSQVGTWLDNLNVTGSAKVNTAKDRSSMVPKLIRKQAEWRYSALTEPFLSTEDVFNVNPVTFEDKLSAMQNSLVLNNQFNTKLDKVRFFDEYIRSAVDEGTAVVRVGWEFSEEEVEVEIPEYSYRPTQNPELVQLVQLVMQDPSQLPSDLAEQDLTAIQLSIQNGVPLEAYQTGSHSETQMKTIKNQPSLDLCDYRNVFIDPTCEGDLSKAGFVIWSFETSLSELRLDGKYSNLDSIRPSSNTVLSEPDHAAGNEDSSFSFSDEPRKKLIAYEYWGFWDINNTGIAEPIVLTYVGDTIIRMEENPYPDKKLPFVAVPYLPVRRSVYGEPDGSLLEDNQKIIGAVTRGMIDVMGKSANGQMGSRKDALDVTNKRKFDLGKDYEFNANVDPRQAFHMHTFPEIPQSAQYMVNMQNMEAEALTGVKAFSGGITGAGLGDTATGVRGALDAASKRELGILRRLADGVKQIGRKIISMNAEFLSEEEVVRITNEEFITIRRDDLAGNFDLVLTISTAEADNAKAQELAFMLQTAGPSSDPAESRMIRAEIARLRKMPTLAKQIEEYQPQPDPIAQRKAELEVQLLEVQIAKEQSMTVENNANAELYMAKVQAELANAGKRSSEKDLNDLEFVEKETGTSHARDLDKVETTARTNQESRAVDSLLKQEEEFNKALPIQQGLNTI